MRPRFPAILDLNEGSAAAVARLRDEVGVLSVYVGISREGVSAPGGEWRIEIKNQIRTLRNSAKAYGNHPYWVAVERRLTDIEPVIESIMDFTEEGRSHAIFCGIESGESIEIRSQASFPNLVLLRLQAYLLPLLGALDEGRQFGVVELHHDEARILQFKMGTGEEVGRLRLEPDSADWRELRWPTSASKSALPQESDSLRDNFEDRVLANVLRSIVTLAETVAALARRNRWDVVVVSGDPRLANGFEKSFVEGSPRTEVVQGEHVWGGLSVDQIVRRAGPLVEDVRRKTKSELASRIRDETLSGGHGVIGLRETLKALRSGRVRTLLFDADLYGKVEGDSATEAIEEAVETALEVGIEVIAMSGEAAEAIEGLGAQLYW